MTAPPATLAFLTGDSAGIGGVLKETPEDFLVEELPLYEPSGAGEHLYLFVEKRELATTDVVRQIARAFRVGKSAVGFAGLKDKKAITRQHFSVWLPKSAPEADAEGVARAGSDRAKVLWAARHANKLRRGHLAGNRFVIYVRQVQPTAAVQAKRVLDRLAACGAPNYVGAQRFGYRGDNATLGRLLLQGKFQELLDLLLGGPREVDFPPSRAGREAYERRDYAAALGAWPRPHRPERHALEALRQGCDARRAVLAIDPMHREFLISATQSGIFNRVLHRRIMDGLFDWLVEGDLAWKHDSRAVFAVDEATAEAENAPEGRVRKLEVSPSGPMWGVDMTRAAGRVAAWELDALSGAGLSEADLAGGEQGVARGVRRPMRTVLTNAGVSGGVDQRGPYVRLAFDLPRGSFATTVLGEIMKNDAAGDAEAGDGE